MWIIKQFLELKAHGVYLAHETFFDTIKARPKNMTDFRVQCEEMKINVRYFEDGCVGISLDETTLADDVKDLLLLFGIRKTVVCAWIIGLLFKFCSSVR